MTSTQSPGAKQAVRPIGKLPVFKTTIAACGFLFRNWRGFAKAALVPVLLSLALDLWSSGWSETSEVGLLVVGLVHSVPETLFSVAWYRFHLAGPTRVQPAWLPSWTSRYWRFLGYTLVFNGLFFAMIDGLSWYWEDTIVDGFAVVLALPILYLYTRFSLIFPAIAVSQTYGLRRSWRLTIGNGWRILLACWLAAMPIWIMAFLIGFAAFFGLDLYFDSGIGVLDFIVEDSSIGWRFVVTQSLILDLAGFVVIGICVVVTSIAYQFCTTLQRPATGAGAEA
jgi:hypothetical protein